MLWQRGFDGKWSTTLLLPPDTPTPRRATSSYTHHFVRKVHYFTIASQKQQQQQLTNAVLSPSLPRGLLTCYWPVNDCKKSIVSMGVRSYDLVLRSFSLVSGVVYCAARAAQCASLKPIFDWDQNVPGLKKKKTTAQQRDDEAPFDSVTYATPVSALCSASRCR